MTVSKPGIDTNPGRATTLQETSQARIRHLDKTEVSLEKAREDEKEPTSTPEGEENRQPSIPVWQPATARKTAKRQPVGKRDSSQPSGRNHAEAPQ